MRRDGLTEYTVHKTELT